MYRYRIQLDEIPATPETTPGSLAFETVNHDNLPHIVRLAQQSGRLEGDEAASTVIGLKLLMEVVLRHRRDPLFAPLEEPLRNFVKALKSANSAQ